MPALVHPPFRTVGLFSRQGATEVSQVVLSLLNFLQNRGLRVLVEEETARLVKTASPLTRPIREIGEEIDLAIVVGGDGTMLNVARHLARFRVPLVGVKLGRLGFLADIATGNMKEALGHIFEGKLQAEERFLLDAEIVRAGEIVEQGNALNDVIVNAGRLARMIEYETFINGEFVSEARGDGIIVATPTGSTAYALSAGGPILHPTLPAIVLCPICPHTLSNRPIVVSSDCHVEIVLIGPRGAYVNFDGQTDYPLQNNDRVRVRRAPVPAILVHPAGRSPYGVLRQKLHWSEKF